MLNRSIAPPFKTIDRIDIMKASQSQLQNGIRVFSISAGSQEITKLEFIFRAGMYQQPATLIASTTNSLLDTGTRSYSADQLSEGIDFYGSFLELQVEQDFSSITVYSLNRYLPDTLKFVEEIVKCPVFPENEFRILLSNKKQKHLINSQKVSVLAKRRFTELLYGADHPYGRDVKESDFERVNIQEIKDFFKAHYNYKNCSIIASGRLPDSLTDTLNRFFGNDEWGTGKAELKPALPASGTSTLKNIVQKDDAIQSAIRIGRVLFNKTHPDYFKFQVLNTTLGGYFGSRLMANIREDKGYTYGIGSGLNNLVHSGYFFIATEVGADVTKATLVETYKEIAKLREELVSDQELETVRNYMLGNFLRSVDGPFSLAEKFKSVWEFGLDYDFFDRYFHTVKTVTPKELREIANQYLQEKDLIECVAGRRD